MNDPVADQSSALLYIMEASGNGRAEVMPGTSEGQNRSDMLQNMLLDERKRCEVHKTNYQTVKAEHNR